MYFDIENDLQETLSKDEKLLWAGRPKTGILFRSSDIYLIPFTFLWFGFAIFWETGALVTGVGVLALFGVPFVLVGFYIAIGRFWVDALKRKNISYGITENRVIIKSGVFSKKIQSLYIKTMSDMTFKEKRNGSGTISFGPLDFRYSFFEGLGYWPGLKPTPALECIEEARKVYTILLEQQRSKN